MQFFPMLETIRRWFHGEPIDIQSRLSSQAQMAPCITSLIESGLPKPPRSPPHPSSAHILRVCPSTAHSTAVLPLPRHNSIHSLAHSSHNPILSARTMLLCRRRVNTHFTLRTRKRDSLNTYLWTHWLRINQQCRSFNRLSRLFGRGCSYHLDQLGFHFSGVLNLCAPHNPNRSCVAIPTRDLQTPA